MAYTITLFNNENKANVINMGFCTSGSSVLSDQLHYRVTGYAAKEIEVGFSKNASLISNNLSKTEFNFNKSNNFSTLFNYTGPSIVNLCHIKSFETGVGQTTTSSGFLIGDKYIKNFSEPGRIFTKSKNFPITEEYSDFENTLLRAWIQSGDVSIENFFYVSYEDLLTKRFFLATPVNANITSLSDIQWSEILSDKFFYSADYYIGVSDSNFNGKELEFSIFESLPIIAGQTLLIENETSALLSGLYEITDIRNKIYIKPSPSISYNFPGQSFRVSYDLVSKDSSVFYVPYNFGICAEVFSKNLILKRYAPESANNINNHAILYHDSNDQSFAKFYLSQANNLEKLSDLFRIGIGVSNWISSGVLRDISLIHKIKEE